MHALRYSEQMSREYTPEYPMEWLGYTGRKDRTRKQLYTRQRLQKLVEELEEEDGIEPEIIREEMREFIMKRMIRTNPFRATTDIDALDGDMMFMLHVISSARDLFTIYRRARVRLTGSPYPFSPHQTPPAASSGS
jgi:hypothetical protein